MLFSDVVHACRYVGMLMILFFTVLVNVVYLHCCVLIQGQLYHTEAVRVLHPQGIV